MKFCFSSAMILSRRSGFTGWFGRGGGIRTPTRGFGDRWSAVKPTPLGHTPPTIREHPTILLDFLMRLVLAAMTAELLQLDALRRRLFVLGRRIVPVLALAALERNDFSRHCSNSPCYSGAQADPEGNAACATSYF